MKEEKYLTSSEIYAVSKSYSEKYEVCRIFCDYIMSMLFKDRYSVLHTLERKCITKDNLLEFLSNTWLPMYKRMVNS